MSENHTYITFRSWLHSPQAEVDGVEQGTNNGITREPLEVSGINYLALLHSADSLMLKLKKMKI